YTVPVAGFTARLKITVPTPVKEVPVATGGSAFALIANTSSSGSVNRTASLQSRPSRSCHSPDAWSNFTMRPVSGPGTLWKFVLGGGRPPGITLPSDRLHVPADAPPSHTIPSESDVVWFPEWNTAA